MRVAVFSAKKYERELLDAANAAYGHDLVYFDSLLEPDTALLAAGFAAVCVFVNDRADAQAIGISPAAARG
jgi:D-lactate dehydrogenase